MGMNWRTIVLVMLGLTVVRVVLMLSDQNKPPPVRLPDLPGQAATEQLPNGVLALFEPQQRVLGVAVGDLSRLDLCKGANLALDVAGLNLQASLAMVSANTDPAVFEKGRIEGVGRAEAVIRREGMECYCAWVAFHYGYRRIGGQLGGLSQVLVANSVGYPEPVPECAFLVRRRYPEGEATGFVAKVAQHCPHLEVDGQRRARLTHATSAAFAQGRTAGEAKAEKLIAEEGAGPYCRRVEQDYGGRGNSVPGLVRPR